MRVHRRLAAFLDDHKYRPSSLSVPSSSCVLSNTRLPVPGFLAWPNSSPLDLAYLGFLDPYWPFGIAAAVGVDGFS
jgi:hypothetical protein